MLTDDAPEFVLVVVVVADLEESVLIRLRDDDSATDGLVYQQAGVGGRYGVPVNPAVELRLDKILVALGLLPVLGLDLLLLAKPSGDGVVLAETLDDEGLHILNLVAVETLEPDYVKVVVRLRDVQHLAVRNLAVDVHLIDDGLQDVDGGDDQTVHELQDPLTHGLVLEVILDVVLDGFGGKVPELLDVADSAGAADEVLVHGESIGREEIELSAIVVHPVNHLEQDLLVIIEGLLCFVDQDDALKAEGVDELQKAINRFGDHDYRQPQAVAEQLRRDSLASTLESIEDDAQVLVPGTERIGEPGLRDTFEDILAAEVIELEVKLERVRDPLQSETVLEIVHLDLEHPVPWGCIDGCVARDGEINPSLIDPFLFFHVSSFICCFSQSRDKAR